MVERIGLLGGTFDPVHFGHLSIVRSFLTSGRIDQLWILPSSNPPHKEEESLTAFGYRKQMLKAAFAEFEDVLISDIERNLSGPSYTIRTLEFLKERFPDPVFYLCIGEDSLSGFESWYKADEILEQCELLVAKRPNSGNNKVKQEVLAKVHFIEHKPVEISSTVLRNRLKRGEDVSNYIPEAVLQIIRKHKLY